MVWHPKQNSKLDNYVLTHVNYHHYSSPPTFNYDSKNNDPPIVTDPTSFNYNLEERAKDFVNYFTRMSEHYRFFIFANQKIDKKYKYYYIIIFFLI